MTSPAAPAASAERADRAEIARVLNLVERDQERVLDPQQLHGARIGIRLDLSHNPLMVR